MICAVDQNHAIFQCSEYQRDIVPFHLMEIIKQSPMLLESNGKDFIIGMSAPQMPIWIWTSTCITESALQELGKYIYNKFSGSKSICYVAKPNVATMLSKPFKEKLKAKEHRVCMESFENKMILPAKNQEILIEKPTAEDIKDIASYMAEFEQECFQKESKPYLFLEKAKSKLDDPWFFVIKQKGKIVATAQSFLESDTHISINQVYTKPQYRGKGFAAALVAYISELIMQKGKTPMLYTDLSNPSSNKAYKNVGFMEKGRVDEITLTWECE